MQCSTAIRRSINHATTPSANYSGKRIDVLYREGAVRARVMAISLHPYLSGVPHRIDAFDDALNHIW